MPSQPSSLTPLGFTREYQTYRAANTDIPFVDSRLLSAVRFWSRFSDALESDSYSSFWLEDLPPVLAITSSTLEDLHPNELAEIAEFVTRLGATRIPAALTAAGVWQLAACKWLYVGEADRALNCLAAGGLRGPESGHVLPKHSIEPANLPQVLIGQLGDEHGPLRVWLTRFDAEWRAIRESGVTNQATCVLVERDAAGRPIRGRLRVLEARVEPLPRGRDADEVVFGHQLVTADDPQVRGAHAAVASLQHGTLGSSIPQSAIRIPNSYLRARFTFANGNHEPHGGDSLAFACFTAAYGDWWSKDLHRERRLVSSQVALTGALSEDGMSQPVAEGSLTKKVERVFFSPLSYLVVPQSNRSVAETEVARLQALHPNRRLRVLTAARASDLITDGNITIPERVCLGEYAVRAAAKYSRSVKVQVPLLAALGYLLLCLLYPKAWVGFDRDANTIRLSVGGVIALNSDEAQVWKFTPECPIDTLASLWVIGNLDADSAREACILLQRARGTVSSLEGRLIAVDDDGEVLFERSAIILNQYPGDTLPLSYYQSHALDILSVGNQVYIMTVVSNDNPGRTHIRLWTADGDSAGWYINAGYSCAAGRYVVDAQSRSLYALGVNNRMGSACMYAIPIDSAYGASPPYSDSLYDLSLVRRGNQSAYLIFPGSDLLRARGTPYSRPYRLTAESGILLAEMDELGRGTPTDYGAVVNYYVEPSGKVLEVRCDDLYRAAWNKIVREQDLPLTDWEQHQKSLATSVMHWSDKGWCKSWPD